MQEAAEQEANSAKPQLLPASAETEEPYQGFPQELGVEEGVKPTVSDEEEQPPVTPFLTGGVKPLKVKSWQDPEVEETLLKNREALEFPEEDNFGIEEE